MKENLGVVPLLVIFVLVCVIAMFVVPMQESADKTHIQEWAAENSVSVVQVERHYWDIGPFWFQNGKVFWFRFRIWGTDVEEYPK